MLDFHVLAGSIVALRDPSSGRFLAYSAWMDDVQLSWEDTLTRATQFRFLSSVDAANDVESTSRVPIAPQGGVLQSDELTLLLPRLVNSADPDIDKYSVYMSGDQGTAVQTDSTFVGWQFLISDRAQCVFEDLIDPDTGIMYREGEEADNIACCEWELISAANDGVDIAEQRKCCDRTLLSDCVANVRRIKQCSSTHAPDESMQELTSKMIAMNSAHTTAVGLEIATYDALVLLNAMTAKAEFHEGVADTHQALEEEADAIVVARKKTNADNEARTAELIANCEKQMADHMNAMQANSEAERAANEAAVMKQMAEEQVIEREGQLEDAQAHAALMESELLGWQQKLTKTDSPDGIAMLENLIAESEASKKVADAEVADSEDRLEASRLQLTTGNYTELGHIVVPEHDGPADNATRVLETGGNPCIDDVTAREESRHAILLAEWTTQEGIRDHNMEIKDNNTLIAVDSRDQEALLMAAHVNAKNTSDNSRAVATALKDDYEAVATGGECCATIMLTSANANPGVQKEQCCNANKCWFNEEKTVITHAECSYHGELTPNGCVCQAGNGGPDCLVTTEPDPSNCFSGTRSNNVSPDSAAACASCYKCTSGSSVKVNGKVVEAGDDVCDRVEGKEHLCLSCNPGAGLIRYGDSNPELFGLGYTQAGRCLPFPKVNVDLSEPGHVSPWSCEQACFPEQGDVFAAERLLSCTKVCSSWNHLMVQKGSSDVASTALCHSTKDAHCHANVTAGTTVNNMHTAGHTCVNHKTVQTKSICYSLATVGATGYSNGYGSTCEGSSLPTTDSGLQAWLQAHSGPTGERWCCYKNLTNVPDWIGSVPDQMWCASAAMEA